MQANTTSTEFLEWRIYLDREIEATQKIDFYLASIACEMRRNYAKSPAKVKLEDLILNFEARKEVGTVKRELTEDEIEIKQDESKAKWWGFLGMKKEK